MHLLEKWERAAGDAQPTANLAPEAVERLADDLDTPGAIARIHALILDEGRPEDGLALAHLMGIEIKREVEVDADIAAQVAERLRALGAREFATADAIRSDLMTRGIALMDYKDEAGQRQTRWELKR